MKKAYLQECPPVLREYLGYTETIKGRSGNTVDEYFIDLRTFFDISSKSAAFVRRPPARMKISPSLTWIWR